MVTIQKIKARTLLRDYRHIDAWFISRYGMNLYRGCTHDCVYCDGRNEKYRVDTDFSTVVQLKENAPSLLDTELGRLTEKNRLEKSYIMFGGGVGDFFQINEEPVLERMFDVIQKYRLPLHTLTKSDNILSYLPVILEINSISAVLTSFSLSTSDDSLGEILEPGAPLPSRRLSALSELRKNNIHGGIYLMPVVPFITDSEKKIRKTVQAAVDAGAEYIVFGGMTLKDGRQRDYFYSFLRRYFPDAIRYYDAIYPGNKWGNAVNAYYESLKYYSDIISGSGVPLMIPETLYRNVLSLKGRISVMLAQIDFILKSRGVYSPYGKASQILYSRKTEGSGFPSKEDIVSIDSSSRKVIDEIVLTGRSSLYNEIIMPEIRR